MKSHFTPSFNPPTHVTSSFRLPTPITPGFKPPAPNHPLRHAITRYYHSCARSTYLSIPATQHSTPLFQLPESSAAANPPPVSPPCLPFDEAMRIKNNSLSRMNFAANINRRVFTIEERAIANVRGKAGKVLLDPERINYIKNITFKLYPVEGRDRKRNMEWLHYSHR